jgi:DUF438 domain-containing protein
MSNHYDDLQTKNVLLTGAFGVLGREISKAFAAQGANLLLVDHPSALDEGFMETLYSSKSEISFYPIDLENQKELIHGYYAAISYMDAQVGILLDALESSGLSENTIIVLWGDHGWHLGDHDLWNKHETKEERIFPILKHEKIVMPVKKMLFEHRELAPHKKALIDAVNSGNNARIKETLDKSLKIIIEKLKKHINLEDEILFRITLENFTQEDIRKIMDKY